MPHPLLAWPDAPLRDLARGSLALSLLVMAVLATIDAGLRCPSAPLGIVSFEIAGASGAAPLLAGWSEAQRHDAILLQGLDYLFLMAYATALASAAVRLARRHAARERYAGLASAAAWACSVSGISDAIENTPMTLMLRDGVADEMGATISLVCASLKFVLLVLGIGYVLVGLALPRREKISA